MQRAVAGFGRGAGGGEVFLTALVNQVAGGPCQVAPGGYPVALAQLVDVMKRVAGRGLLDGDLVGCAVLFDVGIRIAVAAVIHGEGMPRTQR